MHKLVSDRRHLLELVQEPEPGVVPNKNMPASSAARDLNLPCTAETPQRASVVLHHCTCALFPPRQLQLKLSLSPLVKLPWLISCFLFSSLFQRPRSLPQAGPGIGCRRRCRQGRLGRAEKAGEETKKQKAEVDDRIVRTGQGFGMCALSRSPLLPFGPCPLQMCRHHGPAISRVSFLFGK